MRLSLSSWDGSCSDGEDHNRLKDLSVEMVDKNVERDDNAGPRALGKVDEINSEGSQNSSNRA